MLHEWDVFEKAFIGLFGITSSRIINRDLKIRGRDKLTRVKNAVRMRAFPASGANLHVPPPIEIIRDTKTN